MHSPTRPAETAETGGTPTTPPTAPPDDSTRSRVDCFGDYYYTTSGGGGYEDDRAQFSDKGLFQEGVEGPEIIIRERRGEGRAYLGKGVM